MVIARDAVARYLDQPTDSFTWMKQLPRDVVMGEIRRLKVRPVFKGHDRWTHQLVCFLIGLHYPEFLFLLDMGLGKTAIMLDLMTQLIREKNIRRSLVTVPRISNLDSWYNDTLEHSDLEPNLAMGTTEEKWEALINPKGELTVIDYTGLHLALCSKKKIKGKNKLVRDDKKIDKLVRLYDLFCGDEIHKAKNKESLRFDLLSHLTANIDYRFGLTGTPFGRNPVDLWAQFYLIDQGQTLGDTLGIYHAGFFNTEHNGFGVKYVFDKAMYRPLYKRIQHRSIRYSDDEVPETEVPKMIKQSIPVRFAPDQREHYMRAVDGLILAKGNLQELEAQFQRLREITSGYLRWRDDGESRILHFERNPKLDALERVIDEMPDSDKIVISTEFTPSGRLITERLEELGITFEWLHGGSKDPLGCVRNFKQLPSTRVLVMNSESGGTGTDGLQKVCRYLLFYELPVSPITWRQTLKRIARPGQPHRARILDLSMERSIDQRLIKFNDEGVDLHDKIMNGRFSREDLI